MPPTSSPRDHSRRYQPAGQRPPVRVHPPAASSRSHLPPLRPPTSSGPHTRLYPRQQALLQQQQPQSSNMDNMMTRSPSLNSHSYDFRPYPQPGPNALPSLTSLFPPPPRAPPPHVLPPSPPAVHLLPQHAPPPGPRRPITPDPDERLRQLAIAALGPEVWQYRRIYKATVPKNPASGLPHFAPPAGPPPPPIVLPPFSAMLEAPPSAAETIRRMIDADDEDDVKSTSTVRPLNPSPDSNPQQPTVSRRSSTVTHTSDHSSGSHTQSRASPISTSTSSAQSTTRKRHRFGDTPSDSNTTKSDGPLAGLCLSGPSSPERAKASQDWHEASRRMLHPRSVWSPPTPSAKLPDLPLPPDQSNLSSPANRDLNGPSKSTPPKKQSSSLKLQERAGKRAGDRLVTKQTTRKTVSPPYKGHPEPVYRDSPTPHSPPPELVGDMSQETSFSAPLITPNSSFSIEPKAGKDAIGIGSGHGDGGGSPPPACLHPGNGLCLDPIGIAQVSIHNISRHGDYTNDD